MTCHSPLYLVPFWPLMAPPPTPPATTETSTSSALDTHLSGYKKRHRFASLRSNKSAPPPERPVTQHTDSDDDDGDSDIEDAQHLRERIAARFMNRSRRNTLDLDAAPPPQPEGPSFSDSRTRLSEDYYPENVFQWAVLYENQRGSVIPPFSILLWR